MQHPGKTILWAEDQLPEKDLIRKALRQLNCPYEVKELSDGVEVLSYLMDIKAPEALPSLIVLDINMAVMDGRDIMKILRQREAFKHIPVVFYSATNSAVDKFLSMAYGVPLIYKSEHFDECLEAVQEILAMVPGNSISAT